MKILVVSAINPWPADQGDRVRLDAIVRVLSQRHEVTLAVPGGALVPDALPVASTSLPCVPASVRRVLLLPLLPVTVAKRWHPETARMVRSMIAEFHKVLFYQLGSTAWLPRDVDPEYVVIDLTDALSLYYARRAYVTRNPLWRLESLRARRWERSLSRRFQISVVSNLDKEWVRHPEGPGAVVAGNGHWPRPVDFLRRPILGRVLVVGNWHYPPNASGLRRFLNGIWPEVRRALPEATLEVVGKGIEKQRKDLPGVLWTGRVDQLAPYYARAAVAVAPIWEGSGTNNKVLEAVGYEVPVIATAIGAEGLPRHPFLDVVTNVADMPQAIVEHLKSGFAPQSRLDITPDLSWISTLSPLLRMLEET